MRTFWLVVAFVLSLALTVVLVDQTGRVLVVFVFSTTVALILWTGIVWRVGQAPGRRRYKHIFSLLVLLVALGGYGLVSVWLLRPDWLPQRRWYDFVADRQVTERLVDPTLFKVEQWNMLGETHQVLFVHPAASGSTALVYPVKIEPRTAFCADLAVAPEAWGQAGDGVTFSVYVEDEAGMHSVYSQYVDPKHQQQDRRWLPIRVDLGAFSGKLVRFILVTGSGPAGDRTYDWAGWGDPYLERPFGP